MHPSEVQLRKSLEGIGAVDMDVDDFAGLTEQQRAKAITKRDNSDRKKTARLQIALENKQKKEAERLAKLEEKEKEKHKEKKEKQRQKGRRSVMVMLLFQHRRRRIRARTWWRGVGVE